MPSIFLYLLKASGGLLVVYLFYKTALRGLTFYNANRWYLLLLSLFCFVLPLIDINAFIEPGHINRAIVVQAIPAVDAYVGLPGVAIAAASQASVFSMWDAATVIWLAGSLVLLLRLFISYFSYRNLRKKAQPVSYNGVQLFQVDRPILPFSFGNAIYLNQHRHTEAELQEIIRHELVHVRQLHTIDVVLAELMCIINWFNPFAWLLRHAIRQNLEFIADSNVVQHGSDKIAYQYLLLKVMGGVAYPLANQFNLSPLKKRIAMLNRVPSAKRNWVRFLLVLPLAGVLLLACRGNKESIEGAAPAPGTVTFSGIIVEDGSYQGLPGVAIQDSVSGARASTDARGFYVLDIPVAKYPYESKITFSKEGYGSFTRNRSFKADNCVYRIVSITNMKRIGADGLAAMATSPDVPIDAADLPAQPTYEEVAAVLPATVDTWKTQKKFEAARMQTSNVYMVFEGHSYVISEGGWASVDEVTDVVFVDGVRMGGAEVNRKLTRSKIASLGAMDRSVAKEQLGIDQAVLQVSTRPAAEKGPSVAGNGGK